jgi:hypothetical protein
MKVCVGINEFIIYPIALGMCGGALSHHTNKVFVDGACETPGAFA